MNLITRLASMAMSQVQGGLAGISPTLNVPLELWEDEILQTRAQILYKYAIQNRLPYKDLYLSIDCVGIDCRPIAECCEESFGESVPHFEIPQIFTAAGDDAIQYIGTIDKSKKFKVYTSPQLFKFHKYKTRGNKKPYVFLNMSPNKHNFIDGYIFNAPMLEKISVSAIFKDPRQLEDFLCCDYDMEKLANLSFIDTETVDTVVNKYLKYYRQLYPQPIPNDQVAK